MPRYLPVAQLKTNVMTVLQQARPVALSDQTLNRLFAKAFELCDPALHAQLYRQLACELHPDKQLSRDPGQRLPINVYQALQNTKDKLDNRDRVKQALPTGTPVFILNFLAKLIIAFGRLPSLFRLFLGLPLFLILGSVYLIQHGMRELASWVTSGYRRHIMNNFFVVDDLLNRLYDEESLTNSTVHQKLIDRIKQERCTQLLATATAEATKEAIEEKIAAMELEIQWMKTASPSDIQDRYQSTWYPSALEHWEEKERERSVVSKLLMPHPKPLDCPSLFKKLYREQYAGFGVIVLAMRAYWARLAQPLPDTHQPLEVLKRIVLGIVSPVVLIPFAVLNTLKQLFKWLANMIVVCVAIATIVFLTVALSPLLIAQEIADRKASNEPNHDEHHSSNARDCDQWLEQALTFEPEQTSQSPSLIALGDQAKPVLWLEPQRGEDHLHHRPRSPFTRAAANVSSEPDASSTRHASALD